MIGLNYTHESIDNGLLLPSYAYVVSHYHPLDLFSLKAGDVHEIKKFKRYIEKGYVHEVLHTEDADKYFEARWIREILLEAYPYEIDMKFLGKDIPNDATRNHHLMTYFNHFFDSNYEDVVETYIHTFDRVAAYDTSLQVRACTYDDRVGAVYQYVSFVDQLLRSFGYHDAADKHNDFIDTQLHIEYVEGISGSTIEEPDGTVRIEVGNNTSTTLLHELVHSTNRFFRYHYFENHEVCFDHYTKTNEGLANFVAYHLHHHIIHEDISTIDTMTTEPLFFSFYIDIYATLREYGRDDREHNTYLIQGELQKFLGDLWTVEKNDFYVQRFYKFFHYDQHQYFYPKEMMYYLGYHAMRHLFEKSNNKAQLLTQCLLGKICL